MPFLPPNQQRQSTEGTKTQQCKHSYKQNESNDQVYQVYIYIFIFIHRAGLQKGGSQEHISLEFYPQDGGVSQLNGR